MSAEKTATVLAEHQWYDASSADADEPAIGCTGCDDWFSDENALDNGVFAAHQAAMLEPAIREVKAAELEDAADDIDADRPEMGPQINVTEYRQVRWSALTAAAETLRVRAAGIREDLA